MDLALSVTGYAKIERGETDVNYSRLEKIASYYGLSVYDLLALGGEDDKEKQLNEVESIKNLEKLLLRAIQLLEELDSNPPKRITNKKSRPR